jgi:hypothetical protein
MTMGTLDVAKLTGYLAEIAKLEAILATISTGGISPAGYVAAAMELAALYNEVASLTNSPTVTAQDIAAAHAENQQTWNDPKPAQTPSVDPTSIEYNTLDEAKAATAGNYPNVIQKANGKFCVWPNIGPFPGTKVYP